MSWDDGLNPRQVNALRESYQKWPALTPQVEKKLIRWGLLSEQIHNAYEFFRSEVTAEEVVKRKESKEMLIKIMKKHKASTSEGDEQKKAQEQKKNSDESSGPLYSSSNEAVVKKSVRDVTKEDLENIIRIVEPRASIEHGAVKDASFIKKEPVEASAPKKAVRAVKKSMSPVELRDKRERRVPNRAYTPDQPSRVSARVFESLPSSEPPKKKCSKDRSLKSVKIEVLDADDFIDVPHHIRVKTELAESPETIAQSEMELKPLMLQEVAGTIGELNIPEYYAPFPCLPIKPQCSYEMMELPTMLIPQDSRPFTVSPNSAFTPFTKPSTPEFAIPFAQPQFPLLFDAIQTLNVSQMPQLIGYNQLAAFQPMDLTTTVYSPLFGTRSYGMVDWDKPMNPQMLQPQPFIIDSY